MDGTELGLSGRIARAFVRAEITPHAAPIFAMFFGTGAIYHGIKFCRHYVATLGLRGELGPGVALAAVLAKIAFAPRGSMFPPLHLSGQLDGQPLATVESGEFVDYVSLRQWTYQICAPGFRRESKDDPID